MKPPTTLPTSLLDDMIEVRHTPTPVDYLDAMADMEARRAALKSGSARALIWLLEHPALISSGVRARPQDIRTPNRFPQYATTRGGEHTYHGPGQRVVYLVLPLAQFHKDVRAYVRCLQAAIRATLLRCGVSPLDDNPAIGVWIRRPHAPLAKIAAIGIQLRHWISTHGFALNVSPVLEHYTAIVPCGRTDDITSLAAMGCTLSMTQVDMILLDALETELARWQRA